MLRPLSLGVFLLNSNFGLGIDVSSGSESNLSCMSWNTTAVLGHKETVEHQTKQVYILARWNIEKNNLEFYQLCKNYEGNSPKLYKSLEQLVWINYYSKIYVQEFHLWLPNRI